MLMVVMMFLSLSMELVVRRVAGLMGCIKHFGPAALAA
jgi:hypothetical protein